MYIKRFSLLVSFVLFFFLIPSSVSAATYYVAGDTGLDTNNGSISTPWKTIQKAADTMVAGDTVNVKGGITYNDLGSSACGATSLTAVVCTKNNGALGNYITYRQWAGTGIPVIDGSSRNVGFFIDNSFTNVSGFIIKNVSGAPGYGVYIWNESNIISNLLLSNNRTSGVYNYSTATINVNNVTINGIYAALAGGIKTENGSGTLNVYNSIISNSTRGFYKNSSGTIAHDYNNVYNNTTNFVSTTQSANEITTNPLFLDTSLSNFKLQRTSPAINSGTDLTASGVTTDILGVPRPQGAGFDIGAYEYYDIPVTVTGSYPNFTGTSSTIDTGTISSVSYSVDGGTWQTSGVTGTTTFSIVIPQELYIPDGNHTLRVKATDSYTNETDSSIYAVTSFTKDTVVKTTSVNNTCAAVKPEGTPVITSITNLTPTSVKLMFSDSWTNTVDSYFVEYGTKPNVYQYSTQSIGGKGTKETVISNLTPNKTYYFRIRNGNECTVGNWSTAVKNEKLIINNLETKQTTKIKNVEAKTKLEEEPLLRQDYEGQVTPVPTNQNQKTNILQTIINWLTNAFNKIF